MIMIDSKIAQQAAKARHAEQEAMQRFQISEQQGDFYAWQNAKEVSQKAAAALADEVIAHGHHLAEDYSS